jgi:hypothetical protein
VTVRAIRTENVNAFQFAKNVPESIGFLRAWRASEIIGIISLAPGRGNTPTF